MKIRYFTLQPKFDIRSLGLGFYTSVCDHDCPDFHFQLVIFLFVCSLRVTYNIETYEPSNQPG